MADVVQTNFSEIDVPMGTSVQLEFISPPGRHTVQVVGRLPGRSLILSSPKVNGKNILVRESQVVNVRLMLDTSVCAFSSQVAKSYLDPSAHLHIAYPDYVETSIVRKAVRIETRAICSLEPIANNPESIFSAANGILVDLSTGGAKLLSKEDFGSVNQKMNLSLRLKISEYDFYLKIISEIRSQEIEHIDKLQSTLTDNEFLSRMGVEYLYVYGIKFNELPKEVGVPLVAYILEQQREKGR
ncbi:flagellar brake protein [Marinomonas balearica]|uniref:C-di-GMP-binding flagellar brake protein YcgR n=1 Tax=Marinomonas balearica TaxID=491947 RepID=A0A4V3CG82_9GAMM|nr:flagellar brake protein [Marinomonas balearica]TDO96742.1 c-di-GMP-binding flagellar brake protein YcgR [Marinomonas balearica]